MEENNSMDTPQPQTPNTTGMDAIGAPEQHEGSNDNNLSVEDAFMSKVDSDNEAAPVEGQPVDNVETQEPVDNKNDDKRYEYWQSQAAKKENELQTLKSQVQTAMENQQLAPQNHRLKSQKSLAGFLVKKLGQTQILRVPNILMK